MSEPNAAPKDAARVWSAPSCSPREHRAQCSPGKQVPSAVKEHLTECRA